MGSPPPRRGPGPLHPLHPRNPPPVAQDQLPPGMGHRRPTGLATTPAAPCREGKRHREGPRQGGEERQKIAGRRQLGRGTEGNVTRGQGTIGGPGKGKARGHGTGGEGATTGTRTHTREGHTTPEGPAPRRPPTQSTPHDPRRRKPAKTRRRSPDLTPHEPHQVAPTGHRGPRRGRRVHPGGEKGLQPLRKPPRTPRSPPPHPNRQATTPVTARATTRMQRHGHRKAKGTRPRHPGRRTTERQRDRTGGDPTHLRGPQHPTPQNPAQP